MAVRPVFLPSTEAPPYFKEVMVEFRWHSGQSLAQKRRNIEALHKGAALRGISPILEISTKSPTETGRDLSAFHLKLKSHVPSPTPVENIYQASKFFRHGGPFPEILATDPKKAKRDIRLATSGPLIGFRLNLESWPTEPKTAFYDWLYLIALSDNPALAAQLTDFAAFTDIEFNPKKSFSCQARSAALFVALFRTRILDDALANRDSFIHTVWAENLPDAPSQASFL